MPATATRHRFTVEKYQELIRKGAFGENDRVELMNGEIRDKIPIGNRQFACVDRLVRFFTNRLGDRAIVSAQNPIQLGESEPEPDLSLRRPRDDFYEHGMATAADLHLVVEVAESSEDLDRDEKGPMYAEGGVFEYWLVCLSSYTVEVRRTPAADGTWGEVRIIGAGGTLSPAAFPDVVLPVDELLPRGA